uniref:Uncharacterized protein n=1 Tax=Anguilla anguilla TaxID=7936 RepID=A0A0E9QLK6_ANGAN
MVTKNTPSEVENRKNKATCSGLTPSPRIYLWKK